MKALINKEFKLYISMALTYCYIWCALILIPSWPYSMAFIYISFGAIQPIFSISIANKDAEFSCMLPISKNSLVASKHFTVLFLQLAQIVMTIPFALISSLVINKNGNPVSLDANFTLFAVALIGFSAFNITFLTRFFKSINKIMLTSFLAIIANIFTVIILEVIIGSNPVLKTNLDSLNPSTFIWQILSLFIAILIYVLVLFISYKISCKNYEKVDL